jgi:DNA-binding CsgD family transcriptional regulator
MLRLCENSVAATSLVGRRSECATLDALLADARAGHSRAIVLRGEAGIGKSALLRQLADTARGWRVVRAAGAEPDTELAYGGLHELCAPLLDRVDALPAPQRDALTTVFGLRSGPAPDRFLVGLAVLTLFAAGAERQPLLCIVDDAQWLDRASAQIVGFVARRLLTERIALVCATRTEAGDDVLAGLAQLRVGGLADTDACALMADNVLAPLDAAVRDQLIAESHGNPRALLDLPRTWTADGVAGVYGVPAVDPVADKLETGYGRRLAELAPETQLLVLAMAAEPLGDVALLHRAAQSLGVDPAAAEPAAGAGLIKVGARVQFAHPLVRSAAYRAASAEDRRRVHHALADATDARTAPDRRAWHRARATSWADESVAAALERTAGRARARAGVGAASAFLRRSVALSIDPARRAERAIAAVEASLEAGAFAAARAVLASVDASALGELPRARVRLMSARVASASSCAGATAQLLAAAEKLERLDPELAREAYLDAWGSAMAAGELAGAPTLRDVSRAARRAPAATRAPRPSDVLLDGLARLATDGPESAHAALRDAVGALRDDAGLLRWGAPATTAAAALWDIESLRVIVARRRRLARDSGALAPLASALQSSGLVLTWSGDFTQAAAVVAQADTVCEATGIQISPAGALLLAAHRGPQGAAETLVTRAVDAATARGEGLGVQHARWAAAVLYNGLGRYADALVAARRASGAAPELFVAHRALVELVEAGVRCGEQHLAADAAERLAEATSATDSDWALGLAARSAALVSDATTADARYVEAIARLRRTQLRPELARAHLLYGEWLRREGRRVAARAELRTAYDMLAAIGMEAFAERARRELVATGENARKRSDDTRDDLTAQEDQVARLARDGLTNPEIGGRLYLSPRTVEWHLRNVFMKLGISSRRQLRDALPEAPSLVAV